MVGVTFRYDGKRMPSSYAATLTFASTTGYPDSGVASWQDSGGEVFAWSGRTSTQLTGVTRGLYGTTAAAHDTTHFIAGWVAKGLWPENARAGHGLVRDLIGCIVAAAWTLVGYIAAWWQITGSLTVALSNVPSSLLTSAVGLIVALVLAPRLSRAMQR